MKQLLKICVSDDANPGGSCRYVALYESLRHRYFEVRVIDQPEGGEESHRVEGRFDFADADYPVIHIEALQRYTALIRAGNRRERFPEAHPLSQQSP